MQAGDLHMLVVKGLRAEVSGVEVLRGVDMEVGDGEVVFLLGPNGSGKTSLVRTILGDPRYRVVSGRIVLDGEDITELSMEERVARGISATFQIPPKLRGIRLGELARRLLERRGVEDVEGELYKLASALNLVEYLDRDINVGFSGGEMKRAELLLILAQRPKVALLDEIDSGVDVENIAIMGRALNRFLLDGESSVVIITHTAYISRYVRGHRAYVMLSGEVKCEGPADRIVKQILEKGFEECVVCERVWGR